MNLAMIPQTALATKLRRADNQPLACVLTLLGTSGIWKVLHFLIGMYKRSNTFRAPGDGEGGGRPRGSGAMPPFLRSEPLGRRGRGPSPGALALTMLNWGPQEEPKRARALRGSRLDVHTELPIACVQRSRLDVHTELPIVCVQRSRLDVHTELPIVCVGGSLRGPI